MTPAAEVPQVKPREAYVGTARVGDHHNTGLLLPPETSR